MAKKVLFSHYFTGNPHTQGELQIGPWKATDIKELVNEYQWSAKVKCMAVKDGRVCGMPHIHGMTGRTHVDKLVLIGNCCAKELSEQHGFAKLRSALTEKNQRDALLALLPDAPNKMLEEFKEWGKVAQGISTTSNRLRQFCGEYDRATTACRKENGILRRDVTSSNFSALETTAISSLSSGDEYNRTSTSREFVYQIRSKKFVGNGHHALSIFRKTLEYGDEFLAILAKPSLRAPDLARARLLWKSASDSANEVFEIIRDYNQFLECGDLPAVVSWLRECEFAKIKFTVDKRDQKTLNFGDDRLLILERFPVPDVRPLGWRQSVDGGLEAA